jgi:hypothetical protein
MVETKTYEHIDWENTNLGDPNSYNNPSMIRLTRGQILEKYWPYWKGEMEKKFGPGHELITTENCLDDYIVGHFAAEVKENEDE